VEHTADNTMWAVSHHERNKSAYGMVLAGLLIGRGRVDSRIWHLIEGERDPTIRKERPEFGLAWVRTGLGSDWLCGGRQEEIVFCRDRTRPDRLLVLV
jgi:hypothetical protein